MTSQSIPPLIRRHKRPAQPLPANAADCHCHVFGPYDHFPLAATRSYNVAEAPLAVHEAMKRDVGLERTVLVQASGYDTDNRSMVAALRELGPRGRGIAVVAPDAPERVFDELHEAGVRGVRANFATMKSRYPDPAGLVQAFAPRLEPRGWHLQIFGDDALIAALEPVLASSPVDVVIDHMALPDARKGLDQPGFQALLRLLRRGHVWAKLAGADRVTRHTGRLLDAVPFMQALAGANIERLVWGTDWPHIGFHGGAAVHHDGILPYRPLDAGELLDVLATAIPDAQARAKILALNPAHLYWR
jgi:2-pyrone-4,6-dicarboxylate lactonase